MSTKKVTTPAHNEASKINISWPTIFQTWLSTLNSFGIKPGDLFMEVNLFNELASSEDTKLSWWPQDNIEIIKNDIRRVIATRSQYLGPIHGSGISSGEKVTLRCLWEARHDLEQVAAVFICSSLRIRIKGTYHFRLDNTAEQKALYDLVRSVWDTDSSYYPWHHMCSTILPTTSDDKDYNPSSIHSLIEYFAIEHCRVIQSYQAVHIQFHINEKDS